MERRDGFPSAVFFLRQTLGEMRKVHRKLLIFNEAQGRRAVSRGKAVKRFNGVGEGAILFSACESVRKVNLQSSEAN